MPFDVLLTTYSLFERDGGYQSDRAFLQRLVLRNVGCMGCVGRVSPDGGYQSDRPSGLYVFEPKQSGGPIQMVPEC